MRVEIYGRYISHLTEKSLLITGMISIECSNRWLSPRHIRATAVVSDQAGINQQREFTRDLVTSERLERRLMVFERKTALQLRL